MAEDNGKRSPSWDKWQTILTAIGIIITIAIAVMAKFQEFESHRMRVVVLADQSLNEVADSISGNVAFTYEGQPVDNLTSVRIRIENAGNRAIESTHFDKPIEFVFPETSTILRAEVTETNPANFHPKITIAQNIAGIENTLWNDGDRAIVEFTVVNVPNTEAKQSFIAVARILDIDDIEMVSAIDETPVPQGMIGTVFYLLIGALVFSVLSFVYRAIMLSRD